MPKKKWEKPKLIILLRGVQEESVLYTCKTSWNPGPNANDWGCSDSCCMCSAPTPS